MNEHKNIITIEDEIKEFSDKPVKSSAIYKKVKELESNAVPDAPTTDGGYMLKVTVIGGVPTYEWVPGDSSSNVFIAEYGTTTWAAITSAYNQNKAIFCRVPRTGGAYRIAPLSFLSVGAAEFNYYRSLETVDASNPSDEMIIYRLKKINNQWETETRPVHGIIAAGTGIAVTYADNKPVVSAT